MKRSVASQSFLASAVCVLALSACRQSDDGVKVESIAEPAPPAVVSASPPADCSGHEKQIVQLSGQLAASEAKAVALQDRIERLEKRPVKAKVGRECPQQIACEVVAADARTAEECVALDRKLEARYRFLSKEVAELEVQNYLNEHEITEIENSLVKAKK